MALLTYLLTEMSTRKYFVGVELGRLVMLTTPPPSVSSLSRHCGNPIGLHGLLQG
jgi:hypothetical protein